MLWISWIGTTTAALWVSPTGSDADDCTAAEPCATIQHAVDSAACGETVEVMAGTYSAGAHIETSCTAASPLTVRGTDATIDSTSGSVAVFWIDDANYIVLDGFTISRTTSAPQGVRVSGSTGTTVRNIVDNWPCGAGVGFWAYDDADLTVDNVDFGHDVSDDECTFDDDSSCFPIDRSTNVVIKNSTCHDIRNAGQSDNVDGGFYDRITFRDMHNHGLTFSDSNDILVQRSIAYHTNEVTDISDFITLYCSHGVTMRNNTIIATDVAQQQAFAHLDWCANASSDGYGFEYTDNDDIRVVNNVMVGFQKASSFPITGADSTFQSGGFSSDYNLFFGNDAVSGWEGDYYTLSDWQDATAAGTSGNDLHSVEGDPAFVDEGAYDFSIGEGSAAIDAGDDSDCAHEAVGACDIGAFEFGDGGTTTDGCTITLTSPSGDLLSGPPTFRWSGTCDAYRLQLATDDSFFVAFRYDFGKLTGTERAISPAMWKRIAGGFEGGGFWRVIGSLDGALTESAIGTFSVRATGTPPTATTTGCSSSPTSPDDGAALDAPHFEWSSDCDATLIEISPSPDFDVATTYAYGHYTGTSFDVPAAAWTRIEGDFADGGYWRLIGSGADGDHVSEARSFTVGSTAMAPEEAAKDADTAGALESTDARGCSQASGRVLGLWGAAVGLALALRRRRL